MNVFEPTLDMIDIEDIAHALSHACRWAGHVPRFYSVAEHSVHCTDLIVDKSQAFEALMHDASEAYLVDVPRPIKHRLPEYKAIEDNLMRLIAEKFGFIYPMSEEVKNIDNQLLQMEWDCLIIGNVDHKELLSLTSDEAKWMFLHTFNHLKRI
jgi:5'-deoxynucleotidase YfbR-like HD superfamily hydrolase